MAKRDYYEVLGVARTAPADEIKKAFRKLAMQFHPDKNPGDKKAEERFKEINEAYDVLQDPEKRKTYDQFGHMGSGQGFRPGSNPFEEFARQGGFRGAGGGAGGPFGGFGGFSGAAGAGAGGADSESFQDIFGDIFGDFFSGGARSGARGTGPRAAGRARGADLRYTLTITFEESATGTERTITFVRQRGGKEETARLAVTVPAGVRSGQRLKLRGEGDGGPGSGPAGDLYVIVNVQEHSFFKRTENDVHMDLPVSFVNAALGTTVEVPTLTGRVSLKIPAGTYSGQIFRLKGKGFSSPTGSGDQLVKVLVDVPKELTAEQKELLQKLGSTLKPGQLLKSYQEQLDRLKKKA